MSGSSYHFSEGELTLFITNITNDFDLLAVHNDYENHFKEQFDRLHINFLKDCDDYLSNKDHQEKLQELVKMLMDKLQERFVTLQPTIEYNCFAHIKLTGFMEHVSIKNRHFFFKINDIFRILAVAHLDFFKITSTLPGEDLKIFSKAIHATDFHANPLSLYGAFKKGLAPTVDKKIVDYIKKNSLLDKINNKMNIKFYGEFDTEAILTAINMHAPRTKPLALHFTSSFEQVLEDKEGMVRFQNVLEHLDKFQKENADQGASIEINCFSMVASHHKLTLLNMPIFLGFLKDSELFDNLSNSKELAEGAVQPSTALSQRLDSIPAKKQVFSHSCAAHSLMWALQSLGFIEEKACTARLELEIYHQIWTEPGKIADPKKLVSYLQKYPLDIRYKSDIHYNRNVKNLLKLNPSMQTLYRAFEETSAVLEPSAEQSDNECSYHLLVVLNGFELHVILGKKFGNNDFTLRESGNGVEKQYKAKNHCCFFYQTGYQRFLKDNKDWFSGISFEIKKKEVQTSLENHQNAKKPHEWTRL